MYTYQMIGCADDNGKTYISPYGIYSKKQRFSLSKYGKTLDVEELLYRLFQDDCWRLYKDSVYIPKYSYENKDNKDTSKVEENTKIDKEKMTATKEDVEDYKKEVAEFLSLLGCLY